MVSTERYTELLPETAMHKSIPFLATCLLMLTLPAYALGSPQQYRWRDAHNQVHFSDHLTQQAIQNGYVVLNSQGIVTRKVARPLTTEERKATQTAARQRTERATRARQVQAQNQQLLAAYPTEKDLNAALLTRVSNLDQTILSTQINLQSQESTLANLLQRAAEIQHAKKVVPRYLHTDINKQRGIVAKQRNALGYYRARRAAMLKNNQVQLQHYRQLRAKQPAPPRTP